MGFPDESAMPRSQDGSEPIRGGSIGLNRILGLFVDASRKDNRPRFNAILISAFTIFRNVYNTYKNASFEELEQGFGRDIDLFLQYFDSYLSSVWTRGMGGKHVPVIIYFPDYHRLPKEVVREDSPKKAELTTLYKKFVSKHGHHEGEIAKLDHCKCFTIAAGRVLYPHKEVVQKFREIVSHRDSLYTSGDPVCLISHVVLDYYIMARLRGVVLLESFTADTKSASDIRFKLDDQGRLPFYPVTHAVVGDNSFIKPIVSPKIKKQILEAAEKERWVSRSEQDVGLKIIKISGLKPEDFRKYDFI